MAACCRSLLILPPFFHFSTRGARHLALHGERPADAKEDSPLFWCEFVISQPGRRAASADEGDFDGSVGAEDALCCEVRGGGWKQAGCWCDWVCRGRLQSTARANQPSSRSVSASAAGGPMHPPHRSPQQPLPSATHEPACHPSEHRGRQLTRLETQAGLGNKNGTIGPAAACRMQYYVASMGMGGRTCPKTCLCSSASFQPCLTFCSHASQFKSCVELMNMECSSDTAKRQPQEISEETPETRSRSNGGLLMHKPFERAGGTNPWQTGVSWPARLWVAGLLQATPTIAESTFDCRRQFIRRR